MGTYSSGILGPLFSHFTFMSNKGSTVLSLLLFRFLCIRYPTKFSALQCVFFSAVVTTMILEISISCNEDVVVYS